MAATKPVRIEDDLWNEFGDAAPKTENHGYRDGQSGGRSGVIRQFIRWYVGEPGIACPRRPRASVRRAAGGAADTEAFRAELKKAAGG